MSKLLNRLMSMKNLKNLSMAQVPISTAEYSITVLDCAFIALLR